MEKLTKAKFRALAFICACPNKLRVYWRGLGVSPATIAWLENAGLVRAATFPVFGSGSVILRSTWVATDAGKNAGRAALEASNE